MLLLLVCIPAAVTLGSSRRTTPGLEVPLSPHSHAEHLALRLVFPEHLAGTVDLADVVEDVAADQQVAARKHRHAGRTRDRYLAQHLALAVHLDDAVAPGQRDQVLAAGQHLDICQAARAFDGEAIHLLAGAIQTASKGTYTVAFTGTRAGTASTLSVSVNGYTLTTRPTVDVTPGAVNRVKSANGLSTSTVALGN